MKRKKDDTESENQYTPPYQPFQGRPRSMGLLRRSLSENITPHKGFKKPRILSDSTTPLSTRNVIVSPVASKEETLVKSLVVIKPVVDIPMDDVQMSETQNQLKDHVDQQLPNHQPQYSVKTPNSPLQPSRNEEQAKQSSVNMTRELKFGKPSSPNAIDSIKLSCNSPRGNTKFEPMMTGFKLANDKPIFLHSRALERLEAWKLIMYGGDSHMPEEANSIPVKQSPANISPVNTNISNQTIKSEPNRVNNTLDNNTTEDDCFDDSDDEFLRNFDVSGLLSGGDKY